MLTETCEIKCKGKTEIISYPVFESVSEAIEQCSEKTILRYINIRGKKSRIEAAKNQVQNITKKVYETFITEAQVEQIELVQSALQSGDKIKASEIICSVLNMED